MAVPYQVAESTRLNRRQQKLWSIAYIPQKPKAVLVWHHGVGESNDRSKYSKPPAKPEPATALTQELVMAL